MSKQTVIRVIVALVVMLALLAVLVSQKKQEQDAEEYQFKTPPPSADARPVAVNPNLKHMGALSPSHK